MERNWFERTSSNASNIRLANGTDPSTPPGHNEKVDYNPNVPVQVVFGTISFLALFGNFFLAVVILSNRRLLCKRYNVLILNLAVTDMCTGWSCLHSAYHNDIYSEQEHTSSLIALSGNVNPFTPKSGQLQIPPAPSLEIQHHTVWRTWFFIANQGGR